MSNAYLLLYSKKCSNKLNFRTCLSVHENGFKQDKTTENAIFVMHISLHYYVLYYFVHDVSKYISPKPLEFLERWSLSVFYKSKEWMWQGDNLYFGGIQNNFGNITPFSILE